MHLNKPVKLEYDKSLLMLDFLNKLDYPGEIDYRKNRMVFFDQHDRVMLQFNFPLILNLSEKVIKSKNFYNALAGTDRYYFIMLIQTGDAALGYFKNEEALTYKMIRKYMVRKKQGKSQLNYLKTKGKSRAGSRIRLANSVMFFEEINQKLNDWIENDNNCPVLYSCTPMLWGALFNSNIKPAFTKKDTRLKKIPLDLNKPSYEMLLKVARFSMRGYLELLPNCEIDLLNKVEEKLHSPME